MKFEHVSEDYSEYKNETGDMEVWSYATTVTTWLAEGVGIVKISSRTDYSDPDATPESSETELVSFSLGGAAK